MLYKRVLKIKEVMSSIQDAFLMVFVRLFWIAAFYIYFRWLAILIHDVVVRVNRIVWRKDWTELRVRESVISFFEGATKESGRAYV